MNLKYIYIKFLLQNIFLHGTDLFDIPDKNGYVEFEGELLALLPIHNEMKIVMDKLLMTTIQHDDKKIIIYGGGKEYDRNWWYQTFDSDDLLQFIKGNFDFQIALICDISNVLGNKSFRTNISVKNNKISDMYIDMESQDVWLLKDGIWI